MYEFDTDLSAKSRWSVGGTSQLLFEVLWLESDEISSKEAWVTIEEAMPRGSAFRKYFDNVVAQLSGR
jgi:hypothetical protein